MIPDLLEKLIGSKIEAELARLREGGLPPAEVEALAREAKAAFVDRTRAIKEQAAPLIDAAKGALRSALGVPSREELDRLAERLERAVAALERAQATPPSERS
ncbi:MAG TPA: hypothetical protein VFF73_42295 [Planctomycetota bacterium]|nr:hypothetical protein [Planctomycetota bacterium]